MTPSKSINKALINTLLPSQVMARGRSRLALPPTTLASRSALYPLPRCFPGVVPPSCRRSAQGGPLGRADDPLGHQDVVLAEPVGVRQHTYHGKTHSLVKTERVALRLGQSGQGA